MFGNRLTIQTDALSERVSFKGTSLKCEYMHGVGIPHWKIRSRTAIGPCPSILPGRLKLPSNLDKGETGVAREFVNTIRTHLSAANPRCLNGESESQ